MRKRITRRPGAAALRAGARKEEDSAPTAIVELIDKAIEDCETSGDAMRWTPEPPPDEVPVLLRRTCWWLRPATCIPMALLALGVLGGVGTAAIWGSKAGFAAFHYCLAASLTYQAVELTIARPWRDWSDRWLTAPCLGLIAASNVWWGAPVGGLVLLGVGAAGLIPSGIFSFRKLKRDEREHQRRMEEIMRVAVAEARSLGTPRDVEGEARG